MAAKGQDFINSYNTANLVKCNTPSLFSKEMHILAISIFFLRQNLALVENTDIYSTHRSTKKSLNSMGSKSKH